NIYYLGERIPHPNYKNISLRKEVYWKLQRLAEELGTSISQLLSMLLENVNPKNLGLIQSSSINQDPFREQSETPQKTVHSCIETQNNPQNENAEGVEGDNRTECIFVDCPFRNPTEYLKRYGFTYMPEISRCYISNRETSSEAETNLNKKLNCWKL
ncbi:MAG: hypothetical protein QXE06_06390, partial [Candidatus Bathyarchaeia archaeon]